MSCEDDQSVWASKIPTELLHQIFKYAITDRMNLPTICNIGKVCRSWCEVSTSPLLWQAIDLGRWAKQKHANDKKLIWIIENRLSHCKDLNLGNWKIKDYKKIFTILHENCPGLNGIGLSGWRKLTIGHLDFIVENFKSLRMLDLSSINTISIQSRQSVSQQSICKVIQVLGDRLTHFNLSHNRIAGATQIISDLITHCPNLQLLDLSNVRAIHSGRGILHIEKFEINCPKLKVLRLANADITFNTASVQDQLQSPGFPCLEQLSVATTNILYDDLHDEILHRILKASTKLKLLDIRGCKRLTINTLLQLCTDRLKHLFFSGCFVTKDSNAFEVIASKWKRSLTEIDFAWTNIGDPLDNGLKLLAEPKCESVLRNLNLSGTLVSADAVKEILNNCQLLDTINLSSCRSLQRGVKRRFEGPKEIKELRKSFGVGVKKQKISDDVN